MDGKDLRQLPEHKVQMPDPELLAERFEAFQAAS